MKRQYIVECKLDEREIFYNYLIISGYKPLKNFNRQRFIDNHFPFVVEPDNTFWICESITCCAAAKQSGVMISMDEFFECIKQKDSVVVKVLKTKKSE